MPGSGVRKENIKMLQRYISTARNTVYKPIPSKFMPTANDLVVDEISSHGLTPIAAGVTGASRHLKNLRKFHVLSHARALKNVAMLDELKIANIKSEGNNLLNVRNYLQKHVNNLVQVRISLQSELEGKPTIPDLFNDVKEHIILLAQAQEQLREMHKTFFSKVKEVYCM